MNLAKKIQRTKKILLQDDPYIIISKKPSDMLKPRAEDHVYMEVPCETDPKFMKLYEQGKEERAEKIKAFTNNTFFFGADALSLHAFVEGFKPANIIEIGSGNSTHIMRNAGPDVNITCFDPEPRTGIEDVASSVEYTNVCNIDPARFDAMGKGDILFIDGSHYTFNGTDVPYLFLEIIPKLKSGVIVHVHDICLPYEYNALYTSRHYNEQYVLAALLTGGMLKSVFPAYALHKEGKITEEGYSFWCVKT